MTNNTEPFWKQPSAETTAYQRPSQLTSAQRIEHALDRIDAFYSALWDLMPAIAAFGALVILLIVTPHR